MKNSGGRFPCSVTPAPDFSLLFVCFVMLCPVNDASASYFLQSLRLSISFLSYLGQIVTVIKIDYVI